MRMLAATSDGLIVFLLGIVITSMTARYHAQRVNASDNQGPLEARINPRPCGCVECQVARGHAQKRGHWPDLPHQARNQARPAPTLGSAWPDLMNDHKGALNRLIHQPHHQPALVRPVTVGAKAKQPLTPSA
jgi:hypothetical protein